MLEQQNLGNLPVCTAPSAEGLPGDPPVLSLCGPRGARAPWEERAALLVAGGDRLNGSPVGANSHLSSHSSTAPFAGLVQGWEHVLPRGGEMYRGPCKPVGFKLWVRRWVPGPGVVADFFDLVHALTRGQWVLSHSNFIYKISNVLYGNEFILRCR